MAYETSATVLGGLRVDISFSVAPAEPDVGIMSSYVDEWSIVGVNGKPKKNTDWISKKLTAADEEAILEACLEYAGEDDYDGGCDDDNDDRDYD